MPTEHVLARLCAEMRLHPRSPCLAAMTLCLLLTACSSGGTSSDPGEIIWQQFPA